jgi:hypothetical protein
MRLFFGETCRPRQAPANHAEILAVSAVAAVHGPACLSDTRPRFLVPDCTVNVPNLRFGNGRRRSLREETNPGHRPLKPWLDPARAAAAARLELRLSTARRRSEPLARRRATVGRWGLYFGEPGALCAGVACAEDPRRTELVAKPSALRALVVGNGWLVRALLAGAPRARSVRPPASDRVDSVRMRADCTQPARGRPAGTGRHVYLISGLLRCGTCGDSMTVIGRKMKAGVSFARSSRRSSRVGGRGCPGGNAVWMRNRSTFSRYVGVAA